MQQLRRAVGVPFGLPDLGWMVRIWATLFLRTDPELALYGRCVVSQRLQNEGFEFQFANLQVALKDLVTSK